MLINNSVSEIGDIINIYSQVIVNTNISITSFTDYIDGETQDRYFEKLFRYSLDGVTYSDWISLNIENLSNINGSVNGFIYFDFKYIRSGNDSSGLLTFNNLKLYGNIQLQVNRGITTLSEALNELFSNDSFDLAFSNNLLRKIYNRGILPKYIERNEGGDDTDFVSFWNTICMFLSIFNKLSNKLLDITFNREYLLEYVKQNNLALNEKEITFEDLYYLSTNYFDEVRKRGTILHFKRKGENNNSVDGEFLRLINRNKYDEFLFEVIENKFNGYNLDNSSPLYNGNYKSLQLNKSFENTKEITNISKYRAINNTQIEDGYIKILKNQGIGYNQNEIPKQVDISELITVDDEIDYEITFDFKIKDLNGDFPNINIGVLCFNRNGYIKSGTVNLFDEKINNLFITKKPLKNFCKIPNVEYQFRGIIYSKNSNKINDIKFCRTNLNYGSNLKFRNDSKGIKTEKIKIFIYTDDINGDFSGYFINNIKIRPLSRGLNILKDKNGIINIKNPQFLQSNGFCLNWRKNNNQEMNSEDIDNFTNNYLLPYQKKIISLDLKPYIEDKQLL